MQKSAKKDPILEFTSWANQRKMHVFKETEAREAAFVHFSNVAGDCMQILVESGNVNEQHLIIVSCIESSDDHEFELKISLQGEDFRSHFDYIDSIIKAHGDFRIGLVSKGPNNSRNSSSKS